MAAGDACHIGRPATRCQSHGAVRGAGRYRLSSRSRRPSSVLRPAHRAAYAGGHVRRTLWVRLSGSTPPTADAVTLGRSAVLGALFLSPALHATRTPLSDHADRRRRRVRRCWPALSLWWRRRWPLGVALGCLLLGTFSISATAAALLALFSLAVHRPVRPALLVAALWVPSLLLFAVYSPTTDPVSVVLVVTPLALAADRVGDVRAGPTPAAAARCANAPSGPRPTSVCTRTGPGWPNAPGSPARCTTCSPTGSRCWRCTPVRSRCDRTCLRRRCGRPQSCCASTARQALEELRGVDRRAARGARAGAGCRAAPQPTLSDIRRLVEETRRAGARIDFEMQVEHADAVPSALGRDAYRIVQEALTNIGKHANGTATRVRVTGAPGAGLHVSVRNRKPVHAHAGPALPGSGAGLLGLQERVALAGGTLVHGPDGSGDFVVDAELQW